MRDEFNRAEALANDKRAGTVGFALTILQRRLASSPEAIYQSLRRRSERLQKRLRELEILQRGAQTEAFATVSPALDADEVEDLEDAPDNEVEAAEEEVLDQATAARTIGELKAEIATLSRLESLALSVRRSGEDRKWRELASLLGEIFSSDSGPNEPSSGVTKSCPFAATKARDLHRAPGHFELSGSARDDAARPERRSGLDPRWHGPRRADEGAGIL